jgi:hypothetical protein
VDPTPDPLTADDDAPAGAGSAPDPNQRPRRRKTGGRKKNTLNRATIAARAAAAPFQHAPPPPEVARARLENYYQRTYGMTIRDYDAQLTHQAGRCAVCGSAEPGHATGRFAVDAGPSGRMRALLCLRCKTIAGWLTKHGERSALVAAYLQRVGV